MIKSLVCLCMVAFAWLSPPTWAQQTIDDIEGVHNLHIEAQRADIEIVSGPAAQFSWQAEPRESDVNASAGLANTTTVTLPLPALPVQPLRIDDTLFVRVDDQQHHYSLWMQVPDDWAVNIQITEQGSVNVHNRQANVSAWSARGDVELHAQQAAFSVTTMDGAALVDVASLPSGSASAVTAWNGDARLLLPDDLPLELRMMDASEVQTDLASIRGAAIMIEHNARVIRLGVGDRVITTRNRHSILQLLRRQPPP